MQALTFDVFGTLVDWRGGIARAASRIGAAHGITQDWHAFADAWRAQYQPNLERVRSGALAWTPLDALNRSALDALLPRFGLAASSEAERQELTLAWHRLDPWPDVLPGLARLKRRFILAPLSNGNVRLIVDMAKRAGLPWDVILGAELARAYKPDQAVYRKAAALLDLAPAEIMMVAAHYYDLAAAAGCGFRTCYVRRPQEFGPQGKCDLPQEYALDLVVDDLEALAGKLSC
jgi:2-haloacid dehalogenase